MQQTKRPYTYIYIHVRPGVNTDVHGGARNVLIKLLPRGHLHFSAGYQKWNFERVTSAWRANLHEFFTMP